MNKEIKLPPIWCSQICRNAMNEVCVENCAIKRDTSAFEPIKDLELADMPKFPDPKDMTREERFTVVTIYLTKIVDQLQGADYVPAYTPIRRQNIYSSTSSKISSTVQIQNVLSNLQEAISPLPSTEEREDTRVTAETVDQSTD